MSETRSILRFLRNGHPVELREVGPNETLLDYLRLRERSSGTKEGCNEGDCGACTVALGRLTARGLVYEPVNACILLLGQIDGCDLVTVDDLAAGDMLHPVQAAMVERHASQCGFCTPGIVMSLFTLGHSGRPASRAAVNEWLAGNLCRCTGYRPIVDAALEALAAPLADALTARWEETHRQLAAWAGEGSDLMIGTPERFLAAPASADRLAALAAEHPDATIVSGATDVGLWITKQLRVLPKVILTSRAAGFAAIADEGGAIRIGAGATYTDAFEALAALSPDIGAVLLRLGSRQVRASGTIGGNVANGSPIGDSPPVLIALGATLELRHGEATRTLPLEEFFLDYGRQDRKPGELVAALIVPKPKPGEHVRAAKISKRFDQDISAVMAAFRVTLEGRTVAAARLAFGGMAATPKRAQATEAALVGLAVDDEAGIARAATRLAEDFTPISDMRASAAYRMEVAQALLVKALAEIAGAQRADTRILPPLLEAAE